MEKFTRTKLTTWQLPIKMQIQHYIDIAKENGHKLPREIAKKMLNESKKQEIWINDKYQVNILRGKDCDQYIHMEDFKGKCDYISIKTLDKKPIHDWRDLQEIKNELCGKEREALEIYPSEHRLVDTANQYHLWVIPKDTQIPFGFTHREVHTKVQDGGFQRVGQRGKDEN
tara:strand:+ start:625 stop:1137 length:513 start_codon:yes stop_codon:yes gene_type:complete